MKSFEDVAPMVVINPHILSVKGKNLMEEGCLSVPGVQGDVQRPSSITLKYRDRNFLEQTEEFSGMLARVLQHEIDHLSGTLFIDRMEKRDRRKIQKELNDIAEGNIEVDYPLARACSRDGGGRYACERAPLDFYGDARFCSSLTTGHCWCRTTL